MLVLSRMRELGTEVAGWSDRLTVEFVMKPIRTLSFCAALAIVSSSLAFAKPPAADFSPTAPGLHLTSTLGSFKIKRGSEDLNQGTLNMKFTGTVLISELAGQATPGAGVKLDYDRPDMKRKVFHGTGTLQIIGKFSSILFFGRDMAANYQGTGVIQLFGEFDKDLETGYYWYGNATSKKADWGTNGITILPSVQQQSPMARPKIKVKNVTGQG